MNRLLQLISTYWDRFIFEDPLLPFIATRAALEINSGDHGFSSLEIIKENLSKERDNLLEWRASLDDSDRAEVAPIFTYIDRILDTPIPAIGDQAKELEKACWDLSKLSAAANSARRSRYRRRYLAFAA